MKIPFSKINTKEYPFKLNLENMILREFSKNKS